MQNPTSQSNTTQSNTSRDGSEVTTKLVQPAAWIDVFERFGDSDPVWVYCSERRLTDTEATKIDIALADFFVGWRSHGRDVDGQAKVVENRFVVVAAHIPDGNISGCGIDESSRLLSMLADRVGTDWISGLRVAYRAADGNPDVADRASFKKHVAEKLLQETTSVFDLSITKLGDLRAGGFERPLHDSWIAALVQRSAG